MTNTKRAQRAHIIIYFIAYTERNKRDIIATNPGGRRGEFRGDVIWFYSETHTRAHGPTRAYIRVFILNYCPRTD